MKTEHSCPECLDGDIGLESVCATCGRKPGDPPFPDLVRAKLASREWQAKLSDARQRVGLPTEGLPAEAAPAYLLLAYKGFSNLWIGAITGKTIGDMSLLRVPGWLMFVRMTAARLATELRITECDDILPHLVSPQRWSLGMIHPCQGETAQEKEFDRQLCMLLGLPPKLLHEGMRASLGTLLKHEASWAELQEVLGVLFPSMGKMKPNTFKRTIDRAMKKKASRQPHYRALRDLWTRIEGLTETAEPDD
ncbi:MAG: hypothetical protein KJ624_06625 [Chloroflexi bacterium]|nr:hypothetical protein [Chloroflexota bacterium]